jgi:hypothetical protein
VVVVYLVLGLTIQHSPSFSTGRCGLCKEVLREKYTQSSGEIRMVGYLMSIGTLCMV